MYRASFIILYYDPQMHSYFTNYHTPTLRHYHVILRELVINILPCYTSIKPT